MDCLIAFNPNDPQESIPILKYDLKEDISMDTLNGVYELHWAFFDGLQMKIAEK